MNKYRISLCANMGLIAFIGLTYCWFNCIRHYISSNVCKNRTQKNADRTDLKRILFRHVEMKINAVNDKDLVL